MQTLRRYLNAKYGKAMVRLLTTTRVDSSSVPAGASCLGTTPRDLYSNRKASIVKDLMLQDKVLNEYIQRSKNTNWSEDDRDDVEFRELQTVEAGVLKEQPKSCCWK